MSFFLFCGSVILSLHLTVGSPPGFFSPLHFLLNHLFLCSSPEAYPFEWLFPVYEPKAMTICSNNVLKAAFLISNVCGCADDPFAFNHSQSNNFKLFLTFMRGSESSHVLELQTSEYSLNT